jgi:single-strand DNA-binding protein
MTQAAVSFAVNLTDDPEVRYTEAGIARAMFRVAVSGRREQEPSFFTVIVWRDQAEHAAHSLAKGSRVVVVGRLQQRSWTAKDGSARSTVEVVAEELGPSLRWVTTTPGQGQCQQLNRVWAPCQRRLTSMSQTSERVTGGPSSGYSTQLPTTVPWPQSA